jgi:hypothetical protein
VSDEHFVKCRTAFHVAAQVTDNAGVFFGEKVTCDRRRSGMRPAQLLVRDGERHMDHLSSKTWASRPLGRGHRRRPANEDHDPHDRVFRHRGNAPGDVDPGGSRRFHELTRSHDLNERKTAMTALTFIIQLSALTMTSVIAFMMLTIG